MRRDDIIRMAIQADLVPDALWDTPELERFAQLVAEAEREACAKIAENFGPSRPIISITPSQTIRGRWEGEQAASSGIATAIMGQA